MTRLRSAPFLLFLFLFLLPVLLLAQQDEEIDWQYEIDLLGRELARKHCNLFYQTDSTTYFNALDHIADKASEQSLFDISVQLQQVIASMGDANTRINYHFNIDADAILPLSCYWFEDGVYILRTKIEHQEILGKKLTAINGFPLERIIDSLATLIVNENPYLLKSQFPRMITWTQLLDYFGFGEQIGYELEYVDDRGALGKLLVTLPEEDGEVVHVQPVKLPMSWQDQKSYFRDCYLPEDQIYYIQYNKCWSREAEEENGSGARALFMPSFKEFEKQVFQTIKKHKIDKLVFDMRFNGGGNAAQGTKFIKKLTKSRFNGKGGFYVIVGRQTFSSAIINTVDFMENSDALIVGEGTGGRPNYYGEVKRFVLPESKLVVNYSTKYFTLLEENAPCISPGIETPIHFEQYMKGTDPAMEAIRQHSFLQN
ncbi:MAG: hypothetical protein ABFS38_13515 [Bacteroidota bacterium]